MDIYCTTKYVSEQFLDNTQNKKRKLGDFFLNDINAHWKIMDKKQFSIVVQAYINNLLDVKYVPNGYTYSYIYDQQTITSNNYYPMAGRNYWLSVKIDLK